MDLTTFSPGVYPPGTVSLSIFSEEEGWRPAIITKEVPLSKDPNSESPAQANSVQDMLSKVQRTLCFQDEVGVAFRIFEDDAPQFATVVATIPLSRLMPPSWKSYLALPLKLLWEPPCAVFAGTSVHQHIGEILHPRTDNCYWYDREFYHTSAYLTIVVMSCILGTPRPLLAGHRAVGRPCITL